MTDTTASADLVLTGGHVHTVDPALPRAEAVAVRGERIVAVGSAADIAELIGPRTRVVGLAGRTLLPGFQDVHVHPIFAGVDRLQCDLRGSRGRDGVLDTIRAYVASHPDDDWIIGSGWSMADFENGTPRREDLDAIVSDRPAIFPNRDGHSTWVNTKALELAGIDRDTPDPADGRIERRSDGTPAGTLHEGASHAVDVVMPEATTEQMGEGLRIAQAYLHALGITAWQDAIVRPEDHAIYRTASDAGWLTARVELALWWDRERGDDQVEELIERARTGSFGRVRANSVKLMQDGVLETYTGALLEPYLGPDGRPTANRGISFIDPGRLPGWVTRLDAAGLQPHFHAIGDRAVRECLDAVEAARSANGRTDTRPHIAHIQVIHPDDIPRFAALDVVANAQALWAAHEDQMDVLTIPFLGPERATWQYPFGGLLRAGARLAMGSDWSVSTPDPLQAIAVAVTRSAPSASDPTIRTDGWEAFLPEQALTLDEAIRAYTQGSAYVNHLDDDTGSITVGKLADLTMLDRDLFADADRVAGDGQALATAIGSARAIATIVGGDIVFEEGALG